MRARLATAATEKLSGPGPAGTSCVTVPGKKVFNTPLSTHPADSPGHDVDGGSRRDGFLRGLRPVRGARHPRGIPVASPVAGGGGGYGATNAPTPFAVQPPVQQRMTDDPSAGLGFLGAIDGVFLQEKVEMLEVITGCDTHNVYHVTPVPKGMLPEGVVPKEWIDYFTNQAHSTPMLKAREEGECLERVCCPNFRSFTMDFKDGTGATFFTLQAFNCTISHTCTCGPQRMG